MLVKKICSAVIIAGSIFSLTACCERVCNKDSVSYVEPLSKVEVPVAIQKVVYFKYDSYALASDDEAILSDHVASMKADPTLRLNVIGHTDSRGTDAYNLGLGKLRAAAVATKFENEGIAANRLVIISKGKSNPLVDGDNEAAWAQNRRVELEYVK